MRYTEHLFRSLNVRYAEHLFTYNDLNRVFSTFASDLAGPPHPFYPLYADAADVGLVIVLATGDELRYHIDATDRDSEGDVRAWSLALCSESQRKFPQFTGSTVTVFND